MAFILNAYNNALKAWPIVVTSLSTGFCYSVGDLLAQTLEIHQGRRVDYDPKRFAVFSLFGTTMGGPLYYFWFSRIDKMPLFLARLAQWNVRRNLVSKFSKELETHLKENNVANMSMKEFRLQYGSHFDTYEKPLIESKTVLVAKIYADQFIFSSTYTAFFLGTTSIMLDMAKADLDKPIFPQFVNAVKKAGRSVKDKFVQIYVADCAVWPLAQMANFAFVPSHLQPIYVNIINVAWNTFLSYASQGH